jgi:DNA repair exonuclease SbcCD ATPase subunit
MSEVIKESNMQHAKMIAIAAATAGILASACGGPEPAQESARDEAARAESAAAELQRKHTDEAARLDKRVTDLENRWTEMESKIAGKSATATTGLRAEVKEDVKNVREAVADLKTTTAENWWDRHETAMERTARDIEEDVRRFAKGEAASATPPPPETPASAAPFESRRDQFVTRLRARVDRMEEQLKDVRARGAQQTELKDTQARVAKLKDDVDRLRDADADDWWDISSKRVTEYIDRLEDSIRRLDDNKP